MLARLLVLLALPAVAEAATWYRDADGDQWGDAGTTTSADTRPDGYAAQAGDCDDADAAVHPEVDEACDGIDNDCDDLVDTQDPADLQPWYIDGDHDGYGRAEANPYRGCTGPAGRVANDDDCDDDDAQRSPAAGEACNDVDDDCDGDVDEEPSLPFTFYRDGDGDGYGNEASGVAQGCTPPDGYSWSDADCRDDSTIWHPFAFEACTAPLADTNCDGAIGDADNDHDRVRACEDCDDFDAAVRPGAPDTWYDGVIQDCDRASDFDRDLDGFDDARFAGGDDCEDGDAAIHPGAVDVPGDGTDQDCVDGDASGLDTDDGTDDVKVGCSEGCADTGSATFGFAATLAGLAGRRRRIPQG